MIKLYSYPHCSYCRKVQIVLEEKQLSYEVERVDLESGAQHSEIYQKLNPFGKVPILDDHGTILYESGVINEYLEDQYQSPSMLPVEANERASVRIFERIHDLYLSPLVQVLFKQYYLTKPGARDEHQIAETFRQIQKLLTLLNQRLESNKFFGGDIFSLADAAYVHHLLNLLPQFNVDMSSHEYLGKWRNRVGRRLSVKKTNPGLFRNPLGKKPQLTTLQRKSA